MLIRYDEKELKTNHDNTGQNVSNIKGSKGNKEKMGAKVLTFRLGSKEIQ